ncbi:MAG: GerMN domain-containing protein [Actinomycetota bacterium]|nr:GerMN domain-containing protein [Acidimicrobiia bacterium]MDQ3469722.1 GerMN domain-containing protein [Actinomycetota bacterium]
MTGRWLRAGVVVLAVTLVGGGCTIQPDSRPRDIPADQRGQLDAPGAQPGQATGAGRVFLVATADEGETVLRSVLRNASQGEPLIAALLDGPNDDELDDGLASALPAQLSLNSARLVAGTMIVDVSEDILELNSIELRLAIAQLVFTASEIDGVRSVRVRVDGAAQEWPDGRGELRAESLTVFDYPGIAESAQPPFPPVPSDLTI